MQTEEVTIPRLSQMLRVRVPAGLPQAVEIAARRTLASPSEWMRRTLLSALEAEGVHLDSDGRIATPASTPATHTEMEQTPCR
jgi:hypothetical protein